MPNMEELYRELPEKNGGKSEEILIPKLDLDYAFGQLQLSKRAMDLSMFAVTG